jgi:phosphoribosylglycinamide formyltransferase-1
MLSCPPLRVAILSTVRAPGLGALLADPARGRAFDVVGCVASDAAWRDHPTATAAGVPVAIHDLAAFYARRGVPRRDLAARAAFDTQTAELLRPWRPHLIVLCGYLHIVTAPLLDRYAEHVVNLHDADLALTGPDGRPRYRGLHATRDAIAAGERETRSSAHIVTPELDVGPLVLRSAAFPVHPLAADARRWGAIDILRAYAYAHREWMMRAAWGPLLCGTVAMFAADATRPSGDRDARADGALAEV